MTSTEFTKAAQLWAEGMTGSAIAREMGLDEKKLYNFISYHRDLFPIRRKRFKRVGDSEKWRIVAMRSQGMTYDAIARELGREQATVRRWCKRARVA